MSIHAIKPETVEKIRRQRRATFITSAIIGILSVVLVMLVLSMFLLLPVFMETPTIMTYESNASETEQLEVKKTPTNLQRKPSAPSASMAKVIAATTVSTVSIPVPDVEVASPSMDFGEGEDFGEGWGDGSGFGSGGGGASFFNQKVKAERVAYVIDYSLSMKGERERLMRAELAKSVSGLSSGMSYQMIFFAGPTWVAGDEVDMAGSRNSAVIKSGGVKYDWDTRSGVQGWEPKGRKQKPDWIQAGPSARDKAVKLVKTSPLVWGTTWEPALDMAMAMDPAPQIIYFMTDGATGGDMVALAKKIGARAKAKRTIINTVAMMEPKAEKAMKELAERTGGQFTIIDKGGKVREVPLK